MTDLPVKIPGLSEKTRFLLSPASYPEGAGRVELVETHMARVFLTERFAYKMKKPVHSSYLDFSTLDKRYGDCRAELRLNRRLTDDVYLDLVALRLAPGNRLILGGPGVPVEWLVKMRRLPQEASLPRRIDDATAETLAPLLRRLCDFYRTADAIPLIAEQYLERLRRHCEQLRRDLRAPELGLAADEIEDIARALLDFIRRQPKLLARRADAGKIIEGHGDLRPEHCFLTDPPQIIDCLEFSRPLRCLDPVDELGYLALECELLGRKDLGEVLLEGYCRDAGEEIPEALLRFYKGRRAFLRAQLAAAHLQDGEVPEPDKWRRKTRDYLDAALVYCR